MIFDAVYSTSYSSAVLAFGVPIPNVHISQVTLRSVFCPTLTPEPPDQSIRCIRRSNLQYRIHEFTNFHCVYPFMSETFGGN